MFSPLPSILHLIRYSLHFSAVSIASVSSSLVNSTKIRSEKRRIVHKFPNFYFHIKEFFVIVFCRRRQSEVVRCIRLDNDKSFFSATPCPAGHLGYQLEGSFRRSVIRYIETDIGRDDAHQSYILKNPDLLLPAVFQSGCLSFPLKNCR